MKYYENDTIHNKPRLKTYMVLLLLIILAIALTLSLTQKTTKECSSSDLRVETAPGGYNVVDCNNKKHYYRKAPAIIQYDIVHGVSMKIIHNDGSVKKFIDINGTWVKEEGEE